MFLLANPFRASYHAESKVFVFTGCVTHTRKHPIITSREATRGGGMRFVTLTMDDLVL